MIKIQICSDHWQFDHFIFLIKQNKNKIPCFSLHTSKQYLQCSTAKLPFYKTLFVLIYTYSQRRIYRNSIYRMKNGPEVFSLYNFQKNQRIYWDSSLHAENNYKSYKSDTLTTTPLQLVQNKLPIARILSVIIALHILSWNNSSNHGTTIS